MYCNTQRDTQVEVPSGPHPLPAEASSLPSSFRTKDVPPPSVPQNRAGDSDDPSSVADKFAHLNITPTQYTTPSDSERAEKLELSCRTDEEMGQMREAALEVMELWRKSFELTGQDFLLHDLRPVESLREKTNSVVAQNQFEALVNFTASIKSRSGEFLELRKPIDDLVSAKHTTVSQQVEAAIKLRQELTENKMSLRKHIKIILACSSDIWKFQKTVVEDTQNQIESELHVQHDYQEDLQFRMDMLKDGERIAPKVKEPSGLVTTVLEGMGKYGFLKLAKKYKNKWQGSKLQQSTYEREKSKVDSLDQKLSESRNCLRQTDLSWYYLNKMIYSNSSVVVDNFVDKKSDVTFVEITNELDWTQQKLLTLIEMIEEFLAQISQEHGVEFCTRKVKSLCSRLPNIFTALEMLLSAKEVVANDHQRIYEGHIYGLCNAISEHFEVMQEIHWKCRNVANAELQAAFLRDNMPKFQNDVTPHLQGLIDIAEGHISKTKSKEAYEKRAKDDRRHDNSALERPGRPLATSDEIIWALNKVIDALLLIQVVSSASTAPDNPAGENANHTEETAANDSLPWFKMSEEMRNKFYSVLFDEAQKLKFLKDHGQANARANSNEESGGHFARLRRLMVQKAH